MKAIGLRRLLILSPVIVLASLLLHQLSAFALNVFLRPKAANVPGNLAPNTARYRIDAGQSHFTVRAFAGGFLSALAHDHTISVRDFDGNTEFTFGTVE